MMKKFTISALAAFAVAGTSFAGPCPVLTSKEYKQPCVTPCFRDQEWQLDLFYSYNDASHQGGRSRSGSYESDPLTTPVATVIPGSTSLINNTAAVPAGSTVVRDISAKGSVPQYFHDGSGGGVGVNYFFAKYFGIGVEGNWWDGCSSGGNASASTSDFVNAATATGALVPLSSIQAAASAAGYSVTVLTTDATTGDPLTYILKRSARANNTKTSVANQVSGSLILRYPFEGTVCWAPYIFGGGGGVFDGQNTGFGHIGLGVEFRVTPYMGFFTDWRWEFMGGSNNNNSTELRNLAKDYGVDLRNVGSSSKNDVNVTRVGVRFVF